MMREASEFESPFCVEDVYIFNQIHSSTGM